MHRQRVPHLWSCMALQGIVRRIKALECMAGGVSIAGSTLTSAAEQGVSVLDGLQRLLLAASEDSTPQGLYPFDSVIAAPPLLSLTQLA